MYRVYLSPERRPAPHGKYSGYNIYEHDYCVNIAERMAPLLTSRGFAVKIASPELTIYDRTPEAGAWGADYYMAIHTNASTNGENGTAQGALVLTAADHESQRASELVFTRLYQLRPSSRGVQQKLDFYEIANADAPVVYPEIAFHDNPEDAKFLVENRDAIAYALAAGICDYYSIPAPEQNKTSDAALGAALRLLFRAIH